jgi:hypothetical protein
MLILSEIPKIMRAWKNSQADTQDFLNLFENKWKYLDLGCTFTPEKCESKEHALFALQFCVETLKMKEIRMGLRWNNVEKAPGTLSLEYYKEYLEYCFAHNVHICLSVGPIKTPDWPEEHIPEFVLDKSIKKLSKITAQDSISQKSLEYINSLLLLLKSEFTQSQLDCITCIQPENEAFLWYGAHYLRLSRDHVQRVVAVIHTHFPNKKILLNSNGRLNLRSIHLVINRAYTQNTIPFSQFIIGLDYYYITQYSYKLNVSGWMDPIGISMPFDMSCKTLCTVSNQKSITLEVTEAQMEPWHPITTPGNSLSSLKYVLTRCLEGILSNLNQPRLVIRLWGVEYLSKQFMHQTQTQEHVLMRDLIAHINTL